MPDIVECRSSARRLNLPDRHIVRKFREINDIDCVRFEPGVFRSGNPADRQGQPEFGRGAGQYRGIAQNNRRRRTETVREKLCADLRPDPRRVAHRYGEYEFVFLRDHLNSQSGIGYRISDYNIRTPFWPRPAKPGAGRVNTELTFLRSGMADTATDYRPRRNTEPDTIKALPVYRGQNPLIRRGACAGVFPHRELMKSHDRFDRGRHSPERSRIPPSG